MSSVKHIFSEGSKDPYSRLLQKLIGDAGPKPSKKAAFNLWSKSKSDSAYINTITNRRLKEEGLPKKYRASIRSAVVREIFDQKCKNEEGFEAQWEAYSVEECKDRVARWEQQTSEEVLCSPESYQKCVRFFHTLPAMKC